MFKKIKPVDNSSIDAAQARSWADEVNSPKADLLFEDVINQIKKAANQGQGEIEIKTKKNDYEAVRIVSYQLTKLGFFVSFSGNGVHVRW